MSTAPNSPSVLERGRRYLLNRLRPARLALSWRYLRGDGIEIGALHNPLRVPPWARVRYVDRLPADGLRRQYPELDRLDLVDVDVIDDAERLSKFDDESVDFVIANHFIEHCEDPIASLTHLTRVLRARGVLYLAVPDKRATFDRDRPSTTLEHVVRDHQEGPRQSRTAHYQEWVALVSKLVGAAATETAARLESTGYSIHFHCWTPMEFMALLTHVSAEIPFELVHLEHSDDETIFLLRRTPRQVERSC